MRFLVAVVMGLVLMAPAGAFEVNPEDFGGRFEPAVFKINGPVEPRMWEA